jgi:hypothetical protein
VIETVVAMPIPMPFSPYPDSLWINAPAYDFAAAPSEVPSPLVYPEVACPKETIELSSATEHFSS